MNILRKILYKIRGYNSIEWYVKNGLIVGKNFYLNETASLDKRPWLVEIGDNVTISGNVRILTHDGSTVKFLGYSKIAPVKIGNDVFIGLNSVVLPGVIIGNNVIVGAGSIISKDIPDNSVVVGNPAKVIMTCDDYLLKHKKKMVTSIIFDSTYRKNISIEKKQDMKKKLKVNKIGYI